MTSYLIIPLTCCNFLNCSMCFHAFVVLLIHQSKHYILLFLLMEGNILCVLFYLPYFQTIKQNIYLLLEKLDQLRNPNTDFVFVMNLLTDICFNLLLF